MFGLGAPAPAYISLGTPWVYANISDISKSDGGTTGGLEFIHRPILLSAYSNVKLLRKRLAGWSFIFGKGTVVSQSPDGKELIDNEKDVLAENGSVTLIGKAEFKIEGELSDWTRISVPVDYLSEEAPEKMNITISGADYCNRSLIKENNTLSVQSVELIYKDPVSTEKVQLPSDLIFRR